MSDRPSLEELQRRYLFAPYGKKTERLRDLRAGLADQLRSELLPTTPKRSRRRRQQAEAPQLQLETI